MNIAYIYELRGNPFGLPSQRAGDLTRTALRDCPLTCDLLNANHFANRLLVVGYAKKQQKNENTTNVYWNTWGY
jgi:hypothetical protein